MNNKGSIYAHLLSVSVYLLIPLLLLCIVCPSTNEFSACYQNVSIGLFTTSSSDFPLEWNDRACVVNRVVYWEQYICPTPASVLFNYGHYTSMIEKIDYLPCNHYSCMIDKGSSGTLYLKRRQWYFRKLLHLLRKRQWCKRNFQLMRALSILLLLGGDVELNPGPHQIDIVSNCCYDSLSKLSTLDTKNVSGLGIPDLHMDYVCHVAVKLSGLSVPDCNMDYVCHVAMKLSGLSVPDRNMDYVCHVAMKLSGLSVPDRNMDYVCHVEMKLSGLSVPDRNMDYVCHVAMRLLGLSVPNRNMAYVCHVAMRLLGLSVPNCNMDYVCHVAMRFLGLSVPNRNMDYVCHVTTGVSGLSISDVHMEYGCHMCKIELEIESVPSCQEPCCKHDIQLAYMSSLMLLLGGDVELNPGQRQDVVNDTFETTQECESEKQSTSNENRVDSRLVMLSACQRKRLQNETSAERTSRLARLIENQRQRLENESEEQRSVRLDRLTDNQTRRLQNETEEQRSARLDRLTDNQTRRFQSETEEQRSARLGRLADNRACRLQNETEEQRSARLGRLADNRV